MGIERYHFLLGGLYQICEIVRGNDENTAEAKTFFQGHAFCTASTFIVGCRACAC